MVPSEENLLSFISYLGVPPAPFVPLMGAYPIVIDGEMVGAIAFGGAGHGANDETIVLYAIEQFMNF